ncbi:unnamed protein product, partial [Pylaiella littoralis]
SERSTRRRNTLLRYHEVSSRQVGHGLGGDRQLPDAGLVGCPRRQATGGPGSHRS